MQYMLLMHNDIAVPERSSDWETYIEWLRSRGVFRGGSEIGDGVSKRRTGEHARPITPVTGYILVEVDDLDTASALLDRNPTMLAGGTVEIRALPVSS